MERTSYALNGKNQRVYLDDTSDSEMYYCPKCITRVFVRARDSSERIPHFVHISRGECAWYDRSFYREQMIYESQKCHRCGLIDCVCYDDSKFQSEQYAWISNNLPSIRKIGAEGSWEQKQACLLCKRKQYNPIYREGSHYPLCKYHEDAEYNSLKNIQLFNE